MTFSTSVPVITPAPFPPVGNAQPDLRITLSNQLALQLGTFFQNLFPVAQDFEDQSLTITDQTILQERVDALVQQLLQIQMTIVTINQLTTLSTSRIPDGYVTGGPAADPLSIAGLVNNVVLNTINNIYIDLTTSAFSAAQSDYATLRDQLRPYFGL